MIAYAVQVTLANMDVAYSFHALQADAIRTAKQFRRNTGARAVVVHKLVVASRHDLVDVLTACCGHVASHLDTEVVFQLEGLRNDEPDFPKTESTEDLFR